MSAPMIRAILDGRKTQTRRICKPSATQRQYVRDTWGSRIPTEKESNEMAGDSARACLTQGISTCPYGSVGDRLWVRETWAIHPEDGSTIYRANRGGDYQGAAQGDFKWRPSIHMPRWASRITLEITKVRVERLQDISEADAEAEGMAHLPAPFWRASWYDTFAVLWDDINGKGSWDANPWVWVLEFKRVLCGNVTESDSATGASSPKSSFGAGQH